MKNNNVLLCLTLILVSCNVGAGELIYRLDASYSEANPDYSPFENGDGLSLYAEVKGREGIFAFARHTDVNFRPSGPVSGDIVEYWNELGLGFRHPVSEHFSVLGNMSWQSLKKGEERERGHGVQVGLRYQPFQPFGLELYVGRVDILIRDWILRAEAEYHLTQNIYLIARLRDYADWDVTYYEFGAGIAF
ncbi:hypothetical protein [Hahella ganghwensis]|uniref:hypothetical protein n=1 Tax=Hahella ganghwensis TaxID=286420 RepID=UPI00036D9771|nr:hypothetical protein [Hahella ganghwensis]